MSIPNDLPDRALEVDHKSKYAGSGPSLVRASSHPVAGSRPSLRACEGFTMNTYEVRISRPKGKDRLIEEEAESLIDLIPAVLRKHCSRYRAPFGIYVTFDVNYHEYHKSFIIDPRVNYWFVYTDNQEPYRIQRQGQMNTPDNESGRMEGPQSIPFI
jgi:hypothetical protein